MMFDNATTYEHPLPTPEQVDVYIKTQLWSDLKTMEDVTRFAQSEQRSVAWFDHRRKAFTGSQFEDLLSSSKSKMEEVFLDKIWPDPSRPSKFHHKYLDMAEYGTQREDVTETTLYHTLWSHASYQGTNTSHILPNYAREDVDWPRLQIWHPGIIMSLEFFGCGISPDAVIAIPRLSNPSEVIVFCGEYKNRAPTEGACAAHNVAWHVRAPGYPEGVKHNYQVWGQLEIVRPWMEYELAKRGCTTKHNCQHAFYVVGGTHQAQLNLVRAQPTMRHALNDLARIYRHEFVPLLMLKEENRLPINSVRLPTYNTTFNLPSIDDIQWSQ